ncbi:hypothetical protein EBB07_13610 [Paenibacillaceae bacterium]|nr:hypothetical protein EBB07_13610 [Paenibacillaceae bacterium]
MQNISKTDSLIRWNTEQESEQNVLLPLAEADSLFLALPIHANCKSMLCVHLLLKDSSGEQVYETSIVVEWSGMEIIYLLLPEHARQSARTLTLRAADFTYAGTVLSIGAPAWLQQRPFLPVNANEYLLDMFTSEGYYQVEMWTREPAGSCVLTEESGLFRAWNYARLMLALPQNTTSGSIAYSRDYNHDIGAFQAFIVCVSVEPKATFSLYATIDGERRLLIDSRPGSGMEEIRVPIAGNKLQAITIALATDKEGQHVAHVYWFMLECIGVLPEQSHEIAGMPMIADPEKVSGERTEELPLKLLFDNAELARLRQKTASGTGKRFYDEIIAEAEANLAYEPEGYVGTYFPVYWGKQGIERPSVPYEKTRYWFSTLVYSSLAYLLSGNLSYGYSARRALLAAIQCEEWCGGFLCRIPRGITGYRAPFTEAHLMQAVGLCYDFIGDLLTSEEKRAVEDAVYEKAIPFLDMYLRRHKDGYLLESNQGTVYSAGLLYACLIARRSHPDVEEILQRQTAWCLRMIGTYYKPDGTTGEGMMYWEYTTHYAIESLLLISRYQNKSVVELAPPQLQEGMEYVQHMRGLSDEVISFLPIGDCRAERFLYMGPSFLFFAKYYKDASAYGLWHKYYDTPHPTGCSFFGAENNSGQYTTNGLLTFLLHEDQPVAEPTLPAQQRFDCDRIFWRTGTKGTDMLLFFEGGKQTFEHAHYDKGQFIIQAYGEMLAADPGMLDYSNPGHVNYVQSAYHNIVTIRGKNQSYKNADHAVLIQQYDNDGQFNYLQADLENSYKELARYDRTLLFVRPNYFVVLDELAAPSGGMEWNFHSRGALRQADDNLFIAEAPKAGLVMKYASDVPLTYRLSQYEDGEAVSSYNLVLHPDVDESTMNVAAVLVPYPNTGNPPPVNVACVMLEGGALFTVEGAWGTDTLLVRLGGKALAWQGEQITERIRVSRADGKPARSFG